MGSGGSVSLFVAEHDIQDGFARCECQISGRTANRGLLSVWRQRLVRYVPNHMFDDICGNRNLVRLLASVLFLDYEGKLMTRIKFVIQEFPKLTDFGAVWW